VSAGPLPVAGSAGWPGSSAREVHGPPEDRLLGGACARYGPVDPARHRGALQPRGARGHEGRGTVAVVRAGVRGLAAPGRAALPPTTAFAAQVSGQALPLPAGPVVAVVRA
jgi:hypothetical protein